MKLASVATLSALGVAAVQAASVGKRAPSNSFGGSSLYMLHGLSSEDQATYINTLASDGAKVLRLWVTGLGTGCDKGFNVASNVNDLEPDELGTYDDSVLEALDKVLAQMVDKGMKAIISPHNGNVWQSSPSICDVYCSAYGGASGDSDAFYSSDNAKKQYDARLTHILGYKSPSSGQTWGNWSDAILAFDIQNEPFQYSQGKAQANDPDDWICGRSGTMRGAMGDSAVLVATGGIGGDESNGVTFMSKALYCSDIDVMSIHSYVGTDSFWTSYLPDNLGSVEDQGKLMHIEEWGVTDGSPDGFDSQVQAINSQGIPWTYWQFTFTDFDSCSGSCCTGWDGHEVGFSSNRGNMASALSSAASAGAQQDWSAA